MVTQAEPQEDNRRAIVAEIERIVSGGRVREWIMFCSAFEVLYHKALADATLAELVAVRDTVSEWAAKERA